jgi:hypothetical protein
MLTNKIWNHKMNIDEYLPLIGWDRWMAEIEGGAIADLASKRYTVPQLHRVTYHYSSSFFKELVEKYGVEAYRDKYYIGADMHNFDHEELVERYKNLWEVDEIDEFEMAKDPRWQYELAVDFMSPYANASIFNP